MNQFQKPWSGQIVNVNDENIEAAKALGWVQVEVTATPKVLSESDEPKRGPGRPAKAKEE